MVTRGGVLTILFGGFALVVISLLFGFLCVVASKRNADILGNGVIFNRALSDQVYIAYFVGILANAMIIYLIDGADDSDDCRK